ncbi:PglZ domain-containing protein [Leptospira selangorensis]|uniref:PglZ domain-containing protein n=1 Tax=Leptospira selangorensis TaxID=2484982 RepID=A0ABY2NAD8_9LEPT|nr:PglZ domain-containing protein [Leptospira selangorensis]TGM19320.1 PglZ domain-containing protein [Leptospira selangorensis]
MSIQQFIQEQVLLPRLKKSQVLVVYDPDRRYRDVCREMSREKLVVVDASESSIQSRREAMKALTALGKAEIQNLLVYVPARKPIEDEDKQKDPFSLYAACGTVFPEGDGDEYLSICLKAKPDHQTQIRSVFATNPNPSFAVIDAIGGGLSWPNLRSTLKVESTRDILFALLCPSEVQTNALRDNKSWISEAKDLFSVSLGMELKTKIEAVLAISEELWRFILFSEFVFDLPEELPESLINVPRAEIYAKPLIEDICDRLRNDQRTQDAYIQSALRIEHELSLTSACKNIKDLGHKDTFPFEERTFLKNAIENLMNGDLDTTREILNRHSKSVWTGRGESQIQWDFLRSSLMLVQTCQDNERALADRTRSMNGLIDFYVSQYREVDQRHREFEQSVSESLWQDTDGILFPVQEYVRKQYGKISEQIQLVFTKHLQETGWPITGHLSNTAVFDKIVAPKLEVSGHKVAFIVVDALRYELGVSLQHMLAEDEQVEIKPALAQLPSVTLVGMASLLPGASIDFSLVKTGSGYLPQIQGTTFSNVSQRMDWIKRKYGMRFHELRLEDFVRKDIPISPDVDLFLLRSVEIDSHFENNPDTAPNEILNALKRIRQAIHKLKQRGFEEVIIATDHGFFMNTHAGAGDTCSKPPGEWINVHDRSLLGNGNLDSNHFQMSTEKAGIRGDLGSFAGPLSLASYKKGILFYHGGCSLQECIVPVLQLQLKDKKMDMPSGVNIELSYKNGSKRISTRVPVLDVRSVSPSLFAGGEEILIEAHDPQGNVVGEAKCGGVVNPATGTILMAQNSEVKVMIKMSDTYEGKVIIKALHPVTSKVFAKIELETDYTV